MTTEISIKVTWAAIMPGLIASLQDGTQEGQKIAREELTRLAKGMDQVIEKHGTTDTFQESFSLCSVETALCAWEYVMERLMETETNWYSQYREDYGTSDLRLQIRDVVTPKLDAAWDHIKGPQAFHAPFDWEFVPGVLGRVGNPLIASKELFLRAAEEVLDAHLAEMEELRAS